MARILSRIYGALGVLAKGHLVETDRSGLVSGYLGQTATKTREIVAAALGGTLFIDEAYALWTESAEDYGHEAIATLLKAMEDEREQLVVVVAGYPEPMAKLLDGNPGVRSRFSKTIVFPDYSTDELLTIFAALGRAERLPRRTRDARRACAPRSTRNHADRSSATPAPSATSSRLRSVVTQPGSPTRPARPPPTSAPSSPTTSPPERRFLRRSATGTVAICRQNLRVRRGRRRVR